LDDFTWWSGLSASDSKNALESVKSELLSETVEGKTYWFTEHGSKAKSAAYLLPAFDEFIISYKDRSATIAFDNHKLAVSNNGMFHPAIVVNGETIGVWKRTIKKNKVDMQLNYFALPTRAVQKAIEVEAIRYGEFLGREIGSITKR